MMKALFSFGFLLLVFTTFSLLYPLKSFAFEEGEPALVVLSADWCAKCRDLNIIIPDVLNQLAKSDVRIITLDADNESTPQVARRYGIKLEGADLPQVYLYKQGKTSMVLNSTDYSVGHREQAQTKLLNNLKPLF